MKRRKYKLGAAPKSRTFQVTLVNKDEQGRKTTNYRGTVNVLDRSGQLSHDPVGLFVTQLGAPLLPFNHYQVSEVKTNA